MHPGEVTRILVRFAPQDESPAFAFDATAEPGYVWHCHILEHEENDMMRPYHLVAAEVAQALAPAKDLLAGERPAETRLFAPEPNPTTAGAMFRFTLANAGPVEMDVYSITGQRVRRLANTTFEAGERSIRWDGMDDGGRRVAPGVYFVSLRAGGVATARRLLVTP